MKLVELDSALFVPVRPRRSEVCTDSGGDRKSLRTFTHPDRTLLANCARMAVPSARRSPAVRRGLAVGAPSVPGVPWAAAGIRAHRLARQRCGRLPPRGGL